MKPIDVLNVQKITILIFTWMKQLTAITPKNISDLQIFTWQTGAPVSRVDLVVENNGTGAERERLEGTRKERGLDCP